MEDRIKGLLSDGWEIVRHIGSGSLGQVYEIKRSIAGKEQHSALKVISIPASQDEYSEYAGYDAKGIANIFRRQAEDIAAEYALIKKVEKYANFVNYEYMQKIERSGGIGWDILVRMELLKSLPDYYTQRNGMTEKEIIKLGIDICTALEACASQHIIHCNIKPQNIFINSAGVFKLGDFWIANVNGRGSLSTAASTYQFMSPEIYNNQVYGASVDIYSLGLILYWIVNNRQAPFLPPPPAAVTTDDEFTAFSRRFSGEPLPAPASGSPALKQIVLKACEFEPSMRYKSAFEMKADLLSLLSTKNAELNHGNTANGSAGGTTIIKSNETSELGGLESDGPPAPAAKKNLLFKLFIGVVAVLLAVLLLISSLNGHKSNAPSNEASVPAAAPVPTQYAVNTAEPVQETTPVPTQTTMPVPVATTPSATPDFEAVSPPFYGIWCSASEQYNAAESTLAILSNNGYNPYIVKTNEWSNLNSKPFFVVTSDTYATWEDAEAELSGVRQIYPNAYIKYTGDYIG